MAPKKRALEQSDSNVQPKRCSKQQKRDQAGKDAGNSTSAEEQGENDDHVSVALPIKGLRTNLGTKKFHKELNKKKPEEYIVRSHRIEASHSCCKRGSCSCIYGAR